ncbi:MAG: hypothetical protein ACJARX_000810 [Psychroserpens sp.]|jgi:hypothetical protein|uniref:hypothetical protein n=1 Tax=Psychroserpens sp. TaxID=2020870 RepID=UPI0039E5E13D
MAKEEKTRIEKRKIGDKNSVSLIEKMTSHRFLIVRIIGKTIHSIWLGFLAIGVFIAWLVTAVAG